MKNLLKIVKSGTASQQWISLNEQYRSARFFDKSNFPELSSNLFRTEKSAGYLDLSNIHKDPTRSNIL